MYQDLHDILSISVGTETMQSVGTLTRVLDKYKATLYQDSITKLRMSCEDMDMSTLGDAAIAVVYTQVTALLQSMQIVIDYDTLSIDKLASILECLLFEPSDNDSEFLAALDASEDALDALHEILAVHAGTDAVEYMECVVGVSADAIMTIRDTIERNLGYVEKAVEGIGQAVRDAAKHQAQFGKTTVGMEALQAGVEPGIEVQELINARREMLVDLSPEDLAEQIISIAIVAGTPYDAMKDEAMFFLEDLLMDPFLVQKAYKRVVSRLAALNLGNV